MNNSTPKDELPADPSALKAAEEDGRNREWEDRARVNLEPPSEEKTNIERDFEPEAEEKKTKTKVRHIKKKFYTLRT